MPQALPSLAAGCVALAIFIILAARACRAAPYRDEWPAWTK